MMRESSDKYRGFAPSGYNLRMAKHTPEELVKKGSYAEAIPMLLKKLKFAGERSDARFRLLLTCYLETGEYEAAIQTSQEIKHLTPADLAGLQRAVRELGDAAQAAGCFQSPPTLLALAQTMLAGRAPAELAPGDPLLAELRALLEQAAGLPEWPLEAGLLLDEVYQASLTVVDAGQPAIRLPADLAARRSANLLRTLKGFPQHAHSFDKLLELAYQEGDRNLLAGALSTAREGVRPPEWALWLGVGLELAAGKAARALEYLKVLRGQGLSLWLVERARGDIYLELKQPKQALAAYGAALQSLEGATGKGRVLDRALLYFNLAWTHRSLGDPQRGLAALQQGADLWFGWYAAYGDAPLEPYQVRLEGHAITYPGYARYFEKATLWFLNERRSLLEPRLAGLLHFIAYVYANFSASAASRQEHLHQAEALLAHPLVRKMAAGERAAASKETWLAAVDAHLDYWLWALENGLPFDLALPPAGDLSFNDADRRGLHARLLASLTANRPPQRGDQAAVDSIFRPLFERLWFPWLLEGGYGDEIAAVADLLLATAPDDYHLRRARLLGLDMAGHAPGEVESGIRACLAQAPDDALLSAYFARFLENQGRLAEAYAQAQNAVAQAPEAKNLALLERLRERVNAQEAIEYFLQRSLFERFQILDPAERALLAVLLRVGSFENEAHAARVARVEPAALRAGLEKFEQWQLIQSVEHSAYERARIFSIQDSTYLVYADLVPLLLNVDLPRAMLVTGLPPAAARDSYPARAAFRSRLEFQVFQALEALFPPPEYLIAPNLALSTIFDPERMRSLLNDREFDYFRTSPVDLCVIERATQAAVVAFEADSWRHDSPERINPDRIKNKIFHRGGIPLVRLRFEGNVSPAGMQAEIRAALVGAAPQAPNVFSITPGRSE